MLVVCKHDYEEHMFGHGLVKFEAGIPTEVPEAVYKALKVRGYETFSEVKEEVPAEVAQGVVEPTSYENMEMAELVKLAKSSGLKLHRGVKKSEIVEMLKGAK